MPIELDKLTAVSQATASNDQKFFSKSLTGSGKAVGLINKNVRPGRATVSVSAFTSPHDELTRKVKSTSGAVTTHMIPMAPLLARSLRENRSMGLSMDLPHDELTRKVKSTSGAVTTHMIPMAPLLARSLRENRSMGLSMDLPHKDDRFHVTENAPKIDFDVYVDMTPQGIVFYEDSAGDAIVKELNVQYRMEVYVVDKAAPSETVPLIDVLQRRNHKEFAVVDWSYTPLDHIEDLIKAVKSHVLMDSYVS